MAESQGNPAPQAGQGSGAPDAPNGNAGTEYITVAEFKETLNAAITNRIKDFEKSFGSRFEKSLTEKLSATLNEREEALFGRIGSTLEEKLAALKPREPEKPKPDELPAFDLKQSPEWIESQKLLKEQQKQLDAMKAQAAAAQKAAAEERAKSRSAALRSTTLELLGKLGIPPERQKAALALLSQEQSVGYGDNGEGDDLVFRTQDGELPLADGLKTWAKSPEVKFLFPPLNPGGSGGGPGRGPGANAPKTLDAELTDLLTQQFRGAAP